MFDRNAFNFQEHAARMGWVDKDGNATISPAQAEKWRRDHATESITLIRPSDGATVSVNAGAEDDVAEWAKQGFLPPSTYQPKRLVKLVHGKTGFVETVEESDGRGLVALLTRGYTLAEAAPPKPATRSTK